MARERCRASWNGRSRRSATSRCAEWSREGDLLRFEIEADAFLRGMVRAIVGTLLWAGRGKIGVERFGEIVRSEDRAVAGPSAPARGLCLVSVAYDGRERPRRGTNGDDNDQQ